MTIKKLFYCAFFFVMGVNPVLAQKDIGIKFGLNISSINHSKDDDVSNLLDINTGVVFRFKLHGKFLLNTEVTASNKGFNDILIPTGTTANQLTYLSFPVLIEYEANKKIYFQAGPEFNFLTKAKMKNSTIDKNVTGDYNTFDFSFAAGFGFKILKTLNLETRYSLGLSHINKDESISGAHQNRTFQLNLIYLLRSKE